MGPLQRRLGNQYRPAMGEGLSIVIIATFIKVIYEQKSTPPRPGWPSHVTVLLTSHSLLGQTSAQTDNPPAESPSTTDSSGPIFPGTVAPATC